MTELHRRALIGGTVAAAGMASASRSARSVPAPPIVSGPVRQVASRTTLAGMVDVAVGEIVYLGETGREGHFRCTAGAVPFYDPLQGLFVAAATPALHFARIWDTVHGRPEWFGAQTDNAAADCAEAIEACYAMCPVTLLGAADYPIGRTLTFNHPGRAVRGVGWNALMRGQGTRIILRKGADGNADVMLVGTLAKPSGEGLADNHFHDFTLLRLDPCAPHPSGDPARYPTGLRTAHLFHCSFGGISSQESSIGFSIEGVVYTKYDDCLATRVRAGSGGGPDLWIGFYLNGHNDFGYAGGNASIYLDRCAAADQHSAHVDPVALKASGAFVDSFIDRFESARIDTGIAIMVDGMRGLTQSIDLHIRNPVIDGCGKDGIRIDLDQTSSTSIEILDPYIAAAGSGGQRGIAIYGGAGLVTITGGQIHNEFAGGSLYFSRTRGIRVQGTKLHQTSRAIIVDQADGLVLEPQINNYAKTSPAFAIDCRAMSRSIVRPILIGADGPAYRGGVSLDGACHHCEIDGTAIIPNSFSTPDPAFKCWFAGADARAGAAAQAFGAAGNRLAGIAD